MLLAGAPAAFGDAGAPGSTFPEQPGSHPAVACAAITASPGIGFGGQAGQHASPTALAILSAALVDVCFGG